MKYALMIAIAAMAMTVRPPEARADDEGWAAFGGLIGGVVLSEVFHHRPKRPAYHHHPAPPPPCPAPVVVAAPPPEGHFEYREVKVWVPGHYDYERDRCGRRVKIWHNGYYKYETEKVWVPHYGGHRGHGGRAGGNYRKAVHRY